MISSLASGRRWAGLLLPLLLTGCAATQVGQRQAYIPPANTGVTTRPDTTQTIYTPQPVPETAPPQPPTAFAPNIHQSNAGPAVLSLYDAAQQAIAANQLDVAGDDLERAMRIDPRNAFVWSALANLHLQMQQPEQAASEAGKSNSLANGNPYLLRENWRVIATARQAQGDAAGALQAQTLAERYAQAQPGQ